MRRLALFSSGSLPIPLTAAAVLAMPLSALAGPFAPAAGQAGSTAIAANDPAFVEWANGFQNLVRGPQDISNTDPNRALATFGSGADALGPSDATPGNTGPIVSLGDGGHIDLTFAKPIGNGAGADFAVFENGFSDTFLELAHVEVSSNGTNFFRFPDISDTQTTTQVAGFATLDPTNLYDLAGKYRAGFGTPFDLDELKSISPLLDVNDIQYVRIIDVVGSIDPTLGTRDSAGNLINDPFTTPFASGGFDLDAVGVINTAVPEPATLGLLAAGSLFLCRRRRRAGR